MKLDVLFAQSAHAFVAQFAKDGYVPPSGMDGPHGYPSTPVRNACHWLVTLATVQDWDPSPKLRDAAERLRDYLLSDAERPAGFTFRHRLTGKDLCNGVIGPAWTIEALVSAAGLFGDERCLNLAEDLFLVHDFLPEQGAWRSREVDGTNLPVDSTLNHQLWFAAAGGLIRHSRRREIEDRIRMFLDRLPRTMRVRRSGLVAHPLVQKGRTLRRIASKARRIIGRHLPAALIKKRLADQYSEEVWEIGYHAFNTYALAMLYSEFADHPVFASEDVVRATSFLRDDRYYLGLEGNIFGYYYNPPGFEVPYSLLMLDRSLDQKELVDLSTTWVNEQLLRTYDFNACAMNRNTRDPLTLSARIYEMARLPRWMLSSIEVDPHFLGKQR